MDIISTHRWRYPPTVNRHGNSKSKCDIKEIIEIQSPLFDHPTIITSDLHTYAPEVFRQLNEFVYLDKFIVLAAGDMAGIAKFGSDGDPTESYKYMAARAKEFHFVQGNHDLPDKNDEHLPWMIPNGRCIKTSIGTIGGMNGTISEKRHPYKMPFDKYMQYIDACLKKRPRILLTHETPCLPVCYPNSQDMYVGKEELFDKVVKAKPVIHIYGHCHHPTFYNNIEGVHFLNVDARVLIIKPVGYNENLFKSHLRNLSVVHSKKYNKMTS